MLLIIQTDVYSRCSLVQFISLFLNVQIQHLKDVFCLFASDLHDFPGFYCKIRTIEFRRQLNDQSFAGDENQPAKNAVDD